MANKIIFDLHNLSRTILLNHIPRCSVVNVPPTATGKRRFRKEVETDAHKLVNYCCGLNFVQDSPPVKLKPDSEYPDWLWKLRLGPLPNSWELEKGTKEYYLRLAQEERDLNYIKRMTAGKVKKIVGKVQKSQLEYLHYKRFAALAHLEEEDAGLDQKSLETSWHTAPRQLTKRSDYYLPYDETRVLYMDELTNLLPLRNYYYDSSSSFKIKQRMSQLPSNKLAAIQDSKRRHRYACN